MLLKYHPTNQGNIVYNGPTILLSRQSGGSDSLRSWAAWMHIYPYTILDTPKGSVSNALEMADFLNTHFTTVYGTPGSDLQIFSLRLITCDEVHCNIHHSVQLCDSRIGDDNDIDKGVIWH